MTTGRINQIYTESHNNTEQNNGPFTTEKSDPQRYSQSQNYQISEPYSNQTQPQSMKPQALQMSKKRQKRQKRQQRNR